MKPLTTIIIAAFVGIIAAYGTVKAIMPASDSISSQSHKETAFERVNRTGVLRCGFVPWPPGFEIDPNTNEVHGPTKDLFEQLIALTGWKPEFIPVVLGNAVLDLEQGKIDAMCADGPWTISNVKFVDYTTPVGFSPIFVYIRQNDNTLTTYDALNNKDVTFAGIDGDISVDLAQIRFPQATVKTLINMTDPAQMLMELADGKVDAVILDPVTAEKYRTNNPGKVKLFPVLKPLAVYPFMMSVKRGESNLQQTLSRATEMAINIGLMDTLLDGFDPDRKSMYSPADYYKMSKPQ